ncbi:5171_t:CDS:1, partial [Scutellospora calospora]
DDQLSNNLPSDNTAADDIIARSNCFYIVSDKENINNEEKINEEDEEDINKEDVRDINEKDEENINEEEDEDINRETSNIRSKKIFTEDPIYKLF